MDINQDCDCPQCSKPSRRSSLVPLFFFKCLHERCGEVAFSKLSLRKEHPVSTKLSECRKILKRYALTFMFIAQTFTTTNIDYGYLWKSWVSTWFEEDDGALGRSANTTTPMCTTNTCSFCMYGESSEFQWRISSDTTNYFITYKYRINDN